ncbi:MAG TPA: hypothetical protein VEM40_06145 [Nitrospirota bacterium]|nr:hypothetical protein [Nitrospirota bacterium]
MDPQSKWAVIFARSRKRKLLPLDVENCSPIALRNIILDVSTPDTILERIAQVYFEDENILRDLVRCPNLSETTLTFIVLVGSDEIKSFIAGTRVMDLVVAETAVAAPGAGADVKGRETGGKKKLNVLQVLQTMTIPQKIKLAVSGAKDARSLLIRESSKMVSLAVLENPRITIGEVEFFSKSTNLSEDVMRKIGSNSEWSKRYAVASNLVSNPKTPVGISLGFVNKLTDHDLSMLEKSRNVPAAVRTAARGYLAKKKLGKG